MQLKSLVLLTAVLVLISITLARAEEKFGVKVYDGATSINADTWKMACSKAEAYCTTDNATKVIEFYKKQPGLKFLPNKFGGGIFAKGPLNVEIETPWLMVDKTTGKEVKCTAILMCIEKHR